MSWKMMGPSLRENIAEILLANATITSKVSNRVYGQQTPPAKSLTYPYILVGVAIETPIEGRCWPYADIDLAINVFDQIADGNWTDGRLVELSNDVMTALPNESVFTMDGIAVEEWRMTPRTFLPSANDRILRTIMQYRARTRIDSIPA